MQPLTRWLESNSLFALAPLLTRGEEQTLSATQIERTDRRPSKKEKKLPRALHVAEKNRSAAGTGRIR
jgi:hypothetical protein